MTSKICFYKSLPLPIIETERLLMRPMKDIDAVDVVRWRNDPRISSVSKSQSKGEMITIESHLTWFHHTRNNRIDYIVNLKENKCAIGVWNFKEYNSSLFKNCMELGRLIGETWALGRGYAKEASKAWIRFGFDSLKLDAVFSVNERSNLAPQKINISLGFQLFMTPGNHNEKWITLILTRDRYLELVNSV